MVPTEARVRLYRLDAPAAEIAATFDADAGRDPWQDGPVTPATPAPVITGDGRPGTRPRLRPALWGVPPPPRGTQPVTHVRNLSSPFWIGTLRHSELRCLVPATGFALSPGRSGSRQRYWASLANRPIFAFAGILRQGEDWPCFAVLTTDPNRLLARLGAQAMPVILHAEDQGRWLTAEWRNAAPLVTAFPGQAMNVAETPG